MASHLWRFSLGRFLKKDGEKYIMVDVHLIDDIQLMLGLCTVGMIFTQREMRPAKRIKEYVYRKFSNVCYGSRTTLRFVAFG